MDRRRCPRLHLPRGTYCLRRLSSAMLRSVRPSLGDVLVLDIRTAIVLRLEPELPVPDDACRRISRLRPRDVGAVALRRQVANSLNRTTAGPLPTLGGVEQDSYSRDNYCLARGRFGVASQARASVRPGRGSGSHDLGGGAAYIRYGDRRCAACTNGARRGLCCGTTARPRVSRGSRLRRRRRQAGRTAGAAGDGQPAGTRAPRPGLPRSRLP